MPAIPLTPVAAVALPALGPLSLVLIVVASLVLGGAMLLREQRAESLAVKAIWRDALGRHGVSHARLAAMLGIAVTTVDAALSDARDNAVPHWWVACRGLAPQLRADVLAGIDAVAAIDSPTGESLEQSLQQVMLRARSVDTTAIATVSPGSVWRVGSGAASQLARLLGELHAAVGRALPLAARRVKTGGHAAAKGGAR